jgi:hypothetical protein
VIFRRHEPPVGDAFAIHNLLHQVTTVAERIDKLRKRGSLGVAASVEDIEVDLVGRARIEGLGRRNVFRVPHLLGSCPKFEVDQLISYAGERAETVVLQKGQGQFEMLKTRLKGGIVWPLKRAENSESFAR